MTYTVIYEDEIRVDNMRDGIKSLQAFINPRIYEEVYKDEKQESEIDETAIESEKHVDISDPESLDDYLLYAFQQTKVKNSVFSQSGQEIELGGDFL